MCKICNNEEITNDFLFNCEECSIVSTIPHIHI